MSDIVWQDPPDAGSGPKPGRMSKFVEQLRARPGQWAIYPHSNRPSMTTALKKYGCEVTVRNAHKPDCAIYARWPVAP